MKQFHLQFVGDDWTLMQTFDLFGWLGGATVVPSSGVYIVGTSNGTMLDYPWGTSPVYYIGQSMTQWTVPDRLHKLKERIGDYLTVDNRNYPEAAYGVAFGADVACIHTPDGERTIDLIRSLFDSFKRNVRRISGR